MLRKAEIQFSYITIIVKNKTKKIEEKNCPENYGSFMKTMGSLSL
jgi:hypothetical protein